MDFTKGTSYAGLAFNTSVLANNKRSGYVLDQLDPSVVDVAAFLDKRAQHDGVDASDVFLGGRRIGAVITAYGSSKGDFWDKAQALLAAFSPTLNYEADTAALGFRAFNFIQPTADTASWPVGTYPDGIPLTYFARPLAPPTYSLMRDEDGGAATRGLSKQFRVALLAKDPRKYSQGLVEHTITTSTTTATNLGDYPTFPTITIVSTTSTGIMSFTVAGSTFSVTLDEQSKTYTLRCDQGTLVKNGVLAMSLITAGLTFPSLAAGGNSVIRGSVAGTTVTMTFRHAFA